MLNSKQTLVLNDLLFSSSDENEEEKDVIKVISKSTSTVTPSDTVNIYIPSIKLGVLKSSCTDKTTHQYQRMQWNTLKKLINAQINKINKSNFQITVRELFQVNIMRARGLLARNIIQAQLVSPCYTYVHGALVSFINIKFPQIGELILKRLIFIFRVTHQQNDKTNCLSSLKFIANLINQDVLHDRILLQILNRLLENTTDDNVELAVEFIKECGEKLSVVNPPELELVFTTLRNLLHETSLEKRTQRMIEVLFAVQKDQIETNRIIQPDLDLVDKNYQFTHIITLFDTCERELILDKFKYDEKYEETEENYKLTQKIIFHDTIENEANPNSSDTGKEDKTGKVKQSSIIDKTETHMDGLRRKIYFTIHTSFSVDECVHKLSKMNLCREQEIQLCQMIVDSCTERLTYRHFFGLLAQRLCLLKNEYIEYFERIFHDQYVTINRVENIKIRNIAKFFAHLLAFDAISWRVLGCIRLTADDRTSSSIVFIQNLFIELFRIFGVVELNNRLNNPLLKCYFQGLFPSDNDKNIRFAIEFFMSIDLEPLTDQLRRYI